MSGQISPVYGSASSEIHHKGCEYKPVSGFVDDKDSLILKCALMEADMSRPLLSCLVPHISTCTRRGRKCTKAETSSQTLKAHANTVTTPAYRISGTKTVMKCDNVLDR